MIRVSTQVFLIALLGAASCVVRAQSSEAIHDISQVWRTITASYLYSVPEEDLRKAAIQGLLGMDPHAAYMDDAEYNQMTQSTATIFGGIGAELAKREGKLLVVSAMEGSPAAAAGLRPQDLITKINDENAASKSLADAVKMIRGPIGSEVKLSIQHGAEPGREVRVARQSIRIEPVSSKLFAANIAYIRIRSFQAATPEAFAPSARSPPPRSPGRRPGTGRS